MTKNYEYTNKKIVKAGRTCFALFLALSVTMSTVSAMADTLDVTEIDVSTEEIGISEQEIEESADEPIMPENSVSEDSVVSETGDESALFSGDWESYLEEYPNELPAYLLCETDDISCEELVSEFMQEDQEELSAETMASFPVKYDPRSVGKVTSVKNQGYYGTCAAFALASTMESALIAEGIENNTVDLSEAQLAYAKYKEENLSDYWTAINGNSFNLEALKKGYGPVYDWKAPYSAIVYNNENAYSLPDSIWKAHDYDFSHCCCVDDDNVINSTKSLIQRNGGVYGVIDAYMNDDSPYGFRKTGEKTDWTFYLPTDTVCNHAIEIVGWDDNYSASNFGVSVPGNGAWLCKNSWGVGRNILRSENMGTYTRHMFSEGGSGFFWVSYFSGGFCPMFAVKIGRKDSAVRSVTIPDTIKLYFGKKKNFDVTYAPATATMLEESISYRADGFHLYNRGVGNGKFFYEIAMDYLENCNETYRYINLDYGVASKRVRLELGRPVFKMNGLQEVETGKKITISKNSGKEYSVKLRKNCSYQIDAALNYDPEFCTDEHHLLYSSSDDAVATVNEKGEITAKGMGDAVITIRNSDSDIPVSYHLNVKVLSEGITLDKSEICLNTCNAESLSFNVKVFTKEGLDVTDWAYLISNNYDWYYDNGKLSYCYNLYAGQEIDTTLEFKYSDGLDHTVELPVFVKILPHDSFVYDITEKYSEYACGSYEKKCSKCNNTVDYGSFWSMEFYKDYIRLYLDDTTVDLKPGVDYTESFRDGCRYITFTGSCKYCSGMIVDYSYMLDDTRYNSGNSWESGTSGTISDTGLSVHRITVSRAVIAEVKRSGKKLVVKSHAISGAKGYEYQIAKDRRFSKGTKKKTASKTKVTFKSLKKGTTYYVRVRAWKKQGRKKVYGKWSRVRRIKI